MTSLTQNMEKIETLIEEMESDTIELDEAIAHYKTILGLSKKTLTQLKTYKKDLKVLTEEGEKLLDANDN